MKGVVLFVFALIAFFYLYVKHYWKFQIMFNSSMLSLYTPDTFKITDPKRYEVSINLGKMASKNIKVVIASMVRDVEDRIPLIKRRVEAVGSLFKDYRVVIVENDSSDSTRQELLEWNKQNPRVIILGCGVNVRKCSLKEDKTHSHSIYGSRIEKMARLRNIYLDYIKTNFTPEEYTYTFMWDLDIIGSTYLDGVLHSIGMLESDNGKDISVMCSNGIYRWSIINFFYDTYATLDKGGVFDLANFLTHHLKTGLYTHQHQRGENLVEVDSCFSGFAIYRNTFLLRKEVYYDTSPQVECEHTRLHKKMSGKKVINPSLINYVLKNPI